MASSKQWLVLVALGLLLASAPLIRADEYEEDDDGDAPTGDPDEKDVVVLTTKNFDTIVGKSKFALVEFYAPWCGHCKTLKPEYAKAATALKASVPDVVIAKVDATEEADLGTKFGVQGYPTLKWFVDGELSSDYNGGRDEAGIVAWVTKKTGPPAIDITAADELTAAEEKENVLAVGYFKELKGEEYDAFFALAKKTEDVLFGQTTDADVAKAAGLTSSPSFAVIKNFEGEQRETVAFTGSFTEEDSLKDFLLAEKLPLTIPFSQENSDKIFNSGIPKQLLLWGKDLTEPLTAFKEAAKAFKGKLVFVTVDASAPGTDPVTNFFGLKDAEGHALIGFHMEKNTKYRLHEPLTVENIKTFAAGVLDGSAQPEYKSAPIPQSPDDLDGGVQIIVGKTVDSIVLDPKKDVLLEVYAPWCGHCKKLDPVYKKLAKRFAKIDSVVIAKMDGTENEHPSIDAKGFPTILFFPAGAKPTDTPISFEGGDRSLKSLTKFIKQHATVPYELAKKGGEEADQGQTAAKGKEGKDEL